MSKFLVKSFLQVSVFSLLIVLANGCAVSASNAEAASSEKQNVSTAVTEEKSPSVTKNSTSKSKIQMTSGSPADTVRVFYKNLRERRFKEAMMMTNLHYAVEGLNDAEMQDLSPDFEAMAQWIPAEVEINGEIITNNLATVTAKLPDNETGQLELSQVELRREKDAWVIITAGKEAEDAAKKEGKNYFFTLRIDVHHVEVERMMQRISKAEAIYAMQNGGMFTDLQTLVSGGLLPDDVNGTKSTGYRFSLTISADGKKYAASAVPEVYGKTGKLSFLLETGGSNQQANLKSGDNKGQPLKK